MLRAINEHAFNRIHIFDDARHQVAGGALIEVTNRQSLQAGIDFATHVENYILLEVIIDQNAERVEQISQQERADQTEHQFREHFRSLLADDLLDRVAGKHWKREGRQERKHRAKDRRRRKQFVRPQVNRHAADHLPRRAGFRRKGRINGFRAVSHFENNVSYVRLRNSTIAFANTGKSSGVRLEIRLPSTITASFNNSMSS